VVDRVIERLASPECGVFQRSGKLVMVTRDARDDGDVVRPEGVPTIRELVPARLKEIIRTTVNTRDASLAGEVLARGEWSHIRPLDAIVSYPVMRRDGSLLLASGYDGSTRTLAEMAVRVEVTNAPTRDDARAALTLLSELVGDFPFAGDAQRAAWLAMLLTVPARPAIDGPTPLGLFEATQRGSGKSLLADVVSTIITGEVASRRVAPKTREEWDKVLFSILLAGDPLVLFDNVTNMLVSDALDAVLTGTVYSQRLLGVSEDRRVAIRTVFLASANNARLSTDLVRRALGCRLEPDVEQPETRTGFRTPDLLGHVRVHRARYLSAVLTLLRAYAVAGRPSVEARPMGSYGAWCRVVRDSLVWAGAADPAVTQDALRESADVERDELRDLLTAWREMLGERAVTVRELLDTAQTGRVGVGPEQRPGSKFVPQRSEANRERGSALLDALRGVTPNGAEPTTHTIGNRLRTMRGQIVGGLVLREGRRARGDRATYQVLGGVK
jgi:putative DNA primase/helicase